MRGTKSGAPGQMGCPWASRPHLLHLFSAQLGHIQDLLSLLQAEAGEIGCCRGLLTGPAPGICSCSAGCRDSE